jgi:hypothetical protein
MNSKSFLSDTCGNKMSLQLPRPSGLLRLFGGSDYGFHSSSFVLMPSYSSKDTCVVRILLCAYYNIVVKLRFFFFGHGLVIGTVGE